MENFQAQKSSKDDSRNGCATNPLSAKSVANSFTKPCIVYTRSAPERSTRLINSL